MTTEELVGNDLVDEPDVKPGPYVKLSITDTGTGIEPQCLSLIFDPYFTTKDVGKGCGMGLAVVHGIVKSHKGMISVESEPGKGTTFRVYFPQIALEEKREAEDEGPLPRGNERILVVDSAKLDEVKARAVGIKFYVLKPVEKRELARIVRHILDERFPSAIP